MEETEKMEGVIDYMASKVDDKEKERILALKNVGPLHHLCKSNPVRANPHASQNVVHLFRLGDIANSVRRVDPLTGEKINKLRKSYEGKVKDLRLPGRNKAVSKPGEWYPHMMGMPEEDWVNTNVRGKMPENVTASADWQAKLNRALNMMPGKLPAERDAHYRNLINLDDTVAAKSMRPPTAAPLAGGKPLATQHPHTTPPSPAKLARPERQGSKRRYMDSSFVGYGDGFVDDEDGTEDDGRSGRVKKRRKENYSAATTPVAGSSSVHSYTTAP